MYKPIQLTNIIPIVRTSLSRSPLRRGLPRKQQLPRTQAVWIIRGFLLIGLAIALAWFALSPAARAVSPAPDGGYPNGNTAEGDSALFSLTTGADNTAIGFDALLSNSTGFSNTANGAFTLSSNTTGFNNTANGVSALQTNTTGVNNTANGAFTLHSNTTGNDNTANGVDALFFNTTGGNNTASGQGSLSSNTTGNFNTATGGGALLHNTTGHNNMADGQNALKRNTTGSNNVALGSNAGINLTTGSNNIDIFNRGVAGEGNTIRIGKQGTQTATFIAGIDGATVAGGVGVIIDSNGQLGTVTSSARFKDEIQPMDKASEAIFGLKPVTFRYKPELDPDGIPQFGLVAEQVQKVDPDLVARDNKGKAYTVRYEAVNAMLLNEFLKEHRKVEEQETTISQVRSTVAKEETTIAQQQKEIQTLIASLKEQASQIQKGSDELEVSKPAPQLVVNNQ